MESKDVVYIARVFGYHSAENFEKLLKGDESVQLGVERGEVVVSEIVEGVDLSKVKSPVEAVKWQDNARKTAEINTGFIRGGRFLKKAPSPYPTRKNFNKRFFIPF